MDQLISLRKSLKKLPELICFSNNKSNWLWLVLLCCREARVVKEANKNKSKGFGFVAFVKKEVQINLLACVQVEKSINQSIDICLAIDS